MYIFSHTHITTIPYLYWMANLRKMLIYDNTCKSGTKPNHLKK